jgi:thiol-disulfide isomerase/thioredoxin
MPLWASWCGPCREEAPEIQAFYEAVGDQIDVVGVVVQDDSVKARWFAEDFEMTYPSVDDREAALQKAFGVGALPGVAFIAPDGTVADVIVDYGVTTGDLLAAAEAAFDMELT